VPLKTPAGNSMVVLAMRGSSWWWWG